MTQQIVQTRIAAKELEQLDADRAALGLTTRSDALREGLRLLHKQARYAALGRDYDDFYGADIEAPLSDIAAAGDTIASDTLTHEG